MRDTRCPRIVISLYRRHQESCKHTSRAKRNCRCPIWAEGTVHGHKVRKSFDLRDWEAASHLVREWEIEGQANTFTVNEAAGRFVADAKVRVKPSSVLKYEQSVKGLKEAHGTKLLQHVTVDDVRIVREYWKISPITMQKRLEMVKAFYKFCEASGWIEKSPAEKLKGPTPDQKPTMPFFHG